jgi:hypothetical protein
MVQIGCLAIHFEEIPSCMVLNVFLWLLCIIKWSKFGSYLHNTNIWHHFWSKFGYLTPWGDHISGYPLLFGNSFRRNIIMLCPKCISVVTLHYQMVQIGKYLHNTHICGNFWSTFWYLTPGVSIYRVTPHCFAINFEEIPSCFVLDVFLWLLCIIKWSDLGVIFLIPIFGVIFGHNFSIWPPGVSLCSVITCCWAINFEEILSCFLVWMCSVAISYYRKVKIGKLFV